MKRKKNKTRVAAFLTAMLMTVFGLCGTTFAADTDAGRNANIDTEKPISLTATLVRGNEEIAADRVATVKLYQVGKWDAGQGKYVLTDEFAPSGAALDGETGGDILKEIETLSAYADANAVSPLVTGRTQDGKYTFSNLSMGLYMVCSPDENQARANGDNAVIVPFLIKLPLWHVDPETQIGEWQYEVNALPKHGEVSRNPGGNPGGGNPGGGNPGGGTPKRQITDNPGGGTPMVTIDDEGTPLDNLDSPSEFIEDEDVPLTDDPFTQLIEDVLIPFGLIPKTGDGSLSYVPLLTLMAVSGLLIFALIWRKVRKAD